MTEVISPLHFLATGGLVFSFEHATVAGKVVLLCLAIASIFSWSVMVTKMRVIQFARKQTGRFLAAFRQDRQPLRLFESSVRFPGSPVFQVYRAGCEELTFHLLGSAELDETFRARLEIADKITPAQMHAVNAAMERSVGETALTLESQMIVLATAVSGSRLRQSRRDGARSFRRAHYHRDRALCRDPSNVWLQFSRHQYPRNDC